MKPPPNLRMVYICCCLNCPNYIKINNFEGDCDLYECKVKAFQVCDDYGVTE